MNLQQYFINELSFRNGHHNIIILQLTTDQTNYIDLQHSTKNYNVPSFILNKNGSCIIAFGLHLCSVLNYFPVMRPLQWNLNFQETRAL